MNEQLGHDISAFEELMLASLTSSVSKSVLDQTITFWNSVMNKVGDQELEYSDQLMEAVHQLRRVADIQLPFGVVDRTTRIEELEAPRFIGQLDDVSSSDSNARRDPKRKKSALITPDSREDRRSARLKKRAQSQERRRKLPHEDSQIQFVPIEPLKPNLAESQHLTDHQKEMVEAQRLEAAALYPDLNQDEASDLPMSSPIIASVKRRSESFRRRSQETPDELDNIPSLLVDESNMFQSEEQDARTQFYSVDNEMTDPIIPSSPADPSSLQLREEMRASLSMQSQMQEMDERVEDSFPVNENGKRTLASDDDLPPAKRPDLKDAPSPQEILDLLKSLVSGAREKKVEWTEEQRRELGELAFEMQAAARGLL
jgi:hypothetical protein